MDFRRFYAEEIAAVAHLQSRPLIEALARVPRERFLGPGPWLIGRGPAAEPRYRLTVDADPAQVHHNVLVAIDPERELNNGMPSALASWIEVMAPQRGDAILHIGCGTGYYTAIMAEIVGAACRVLAFEVDPDLAARATVNLAAWPQVQVVAGDASTIPGVFDAVFVNAGATHARAEWLGALRPAGRLMLPLTAHMPGIPFAVGVMLRIDHAPGGRWPVRVVSEVGIYDCASARDPDREQQLVALAAAGTAGTIRALSVEPHDRGPSCLCHGPGFCLQS
jgi:protein-L-isoaspartate(D-aspartate) O-methyltransferase